MIIRITNQQRIRWKFGALAGLAVVLVTMIPQVSLWVARGHEGHGAYAITDTDELVYSAYLNSVIKGKPRRNDPFLPGAAATAAKHETYFSIQSLPPYVIGLVARLFGFSASTAFILLTPLLAFASSLAIFWLITEVTGDEKAAAIGVLLILLCGVLASANLLVEDNFYAVFSFLRRYIPALPFPLFFMFCVFVWRAFNGSGASSTRWAIGAGAVLVTLIYSYFYLWTTAGAMLFTLTVLWLVVHKGVRPRIIKIAAIIGVMAVAALVPYFRLLSLRAHTIDQDQALLLTHAPDLFRFTEILGALILVALVYRIRKGHLDFRSPLVLFTAACAITPFIVLNQQVITGRSLQPFHFEQFILSYLVLVGVVVLDTLWWKHLTRYPLLWIALPLVVGVSLALKTTKVNSAQNHAIDGAIPLLRTLELEVKQNAFTESVLFDRTIYAASAPTYTSSLQTLWSPYTYTYGSVSHEEDNERLYQNFYYLGVDEKRFASLLEGRIYRAALFGLHRVNKTLTQKFEPITRDEIQAQVGQYVQYVQTFSKAQAQRWPLSHVVLTADRNYNLSNLDRWYERDGGQRLGDSIIYRVRLKG